MACCQGKRKTFGRKKPILFRSPNFKIKLIARPILNKHFHCWCFHIVHDGNWNLEDQLGKIINTNGFNHPWRWVVPHIHAVPHPPKNVSRLGIMANNMAIDNALAFIRLSKLYKCANVHVFGLWLNSTSPARRSQETKHQFSIRQLHMQLELCLKINSCSCKTSSCPPLTSKHSTLFPQPRMTSVLTCRHQVSFYMHGCNHFQKVQDCNDFSEECGAEARGEDKGFQLHVGMKWPYLSSWTMAFQWPQQTPISEVGSSPALSLSSGRV